VAEPVRRLGGPIMARTNLRKTGHLWGTKWPAQSSARWAIYAGQKSLASNEMACLPTIIPLFPFYQFYLF